MRLMEEEEALRNRPKEEEPSLIERIPEKVLIVLLLIVVVIFLAGFIYFLYKVEKQNKQIKLARAIQQR